MLCRLLLLWPAVGRGTRLTPTAWFAVLRIRRSAFAFDQRIAIEIGPVQQAPDHQSHQEMWHKDGDLVDHGPLFTVPGLTPGMHVFDGAIG